MKEQMAELQIPGFADVQELSEDDEDRSEA